MEFFKQKTHYDFLSVRRWAIGLSIALFVFAMASLIIKGLNFGLDFTGGTEIKLSYQQAADLAHVRTALSQSGFDQAVVQAFGNSQTVKVRVGVHNSVDQQQLKTKIIQALPKAKILSIEFIGPQVGKQLATKGALGLLVALIGTAIYIALRFEYRFAVSAAVALIHDPILILGVFSFLHMEFNLITLAALLTVIGYSLNDTVVVFDRIRENFRRVRKGTVEDIVNLSVNQTLSRTIMTSFMTLLAVLALFYFGGAVVHGFALALIIGIVVGTYSSIYIAGALVIALGLSRGDLLPQPKTALDERP